MNDVSLPYPGLRPFTENESFLFFGREKQTDQLLEKLGHTRFLSVIGPSGSGKSSLVRAGMIADLKTGFMASAGPKWWIATMRPGAQPMRRLAEALSEKSASGGDPKGNELTTSFVEATLESGPLGLIEVVRNSPLRTDANLLILVDQFEEIFRFRSEGNDNEADAFVALLLETASQRDIPIYIVLTMRADYLGDCSVFTGLPEAINAGQFLTPRMTREQRGEAIQGPARVFGGVIDPPLLNRLLNETSSDPNLLPVLQHLLMRMWMLKSMGPKEDGPITLTMEDYANAGGISDALSIHADEAFNSLKSEEEKRIAEVIFRSLCERGKDKRDSRRPTKVQEIADRAGLKKEPGKIIAVAEVFREPRCSFIFPAPPEQLNPGTMLDISHESLIAKWKKLNEWAQQEADSVEEYHFLEQSARQWKHADKVASALWGTPHLEKALAWREKEHPTREWASRYGGNFELAMAFLEASEAHRSALRLKAEQERVLELQKAKRNAVKATIAVCILSFLIVAGLGLWWLGFVKPHQTYFKSFAKRNGEPVGIGGISKGLVERRQYSYRIVTKGYFGHVLRLEAIDNKFQPTWHHSVRTYLNPNADLAALHECKWEFFYDSEGNLVSETARDKGNKTKWVFLYTYLRDEKNCKSDAKNCNREGLFLEARSANPALDSSINDTGSTDVAYGLNGGEGGVNSTEDPAAGRGKPRGIKDGATFPAGKVDVYLRLSEPKLVRISYGLRGTEDTLHYFDASGNPIRGPNQAYGMAQEFDENMQLTRQTSLDILNSPMNDSVGNASMGYEYDDQGNCIRASAFDLSGKPVLIDDGWCIRVSKFDRAGNDTLDAYYGTEDSEKILRKEGYHAVKNTMDLDRRIASAIFLDTNLAPTFNKDGVHKISWEYDSAGNIVAECHFDTAGKAALNKSGYSKITVGYDASEIINAKAFYGTDGQLVEGPNGYCKVEILRKNAKVKIEETIFYGRNGERIPNSDGYARRQDKFDSSGSRIKETCYFGPDGAKVLGKLGFWKIERKFDKMGHLIRGDYFDTSVLRTIGNDGYASWSQEYDVAGNIVQTNYFGKDGLPTNGKSGYAIKKSSFDENGNPVIITLFGSDGNRTTGSEGYAWKILKHDAFGNLTESREFGLDNKPICKESACGSRWDYDDRGNVKRESWIGADGQLVLGPQGYAFALHEYDKHSREIATKYYGADSQAVLYNGLYSVKRFSYDMNGNRVGRSFFGRDSQPVNGEKGYAADSNYYDERGNDTASAYFDIYGEPTASTDGYARVAYSYDQYGRRVATTYFDTERKKSALPGNGYATIRTVHNARGFAIEEAYFGVDGEPALTRDIYHMVKREFDNFGNATKFNYYGRDSAKTLAQNAYFELRKKFDLMGNMVEQSIYGTNGNRVSIDDGSHMSTRRYDPLGNRIEETFFDKHLKMLRSAYGYYSIGWEYDSQGRKIKEFYLDAKHQPCNSNLGYAIIATEYDKLGKTKSTKCFEKGLKPVNCE